MWGGQEHLQTSTPDYEGKREGGASRCLARGGGMDAAKQAVVGGERGEGEGEEQGVRVQQAGMRRWRKERERGRERDRKENDEKERKG